MEVSTHGKMFKNFSPFQGRWPNSIHTHCKPSAQRADPLTRECLWFVQIRHDLLNNHRTRRNVMGPPQSIEITCEALLPQAPHRLWFKGVKPTTCRNIAFRKDLLTITL